MSEKPRLGRLSKAATAILEDYVLKHPDDTYPTTIVRRSLLEQVQKAQNNPDIKIRTIGNWFKRRRSEVQAAVMQQSGEPLTPTSPTSPSSPLSEESLRLLHTLVQTTPSPPPNVLDAWASLFHVSLPVLQYAIIMVLPHRFPSSQEQTSSRDQAQSPESGCPVVTDKIIYPESTYSQQLPTPSDSLTPEPTFRSHRLDIISPDFCKGEIISPTLEHHQLAEHRAGQPGCSQLTPPLTPIAPATRVNLGMPGSTQTNAPEPNVTPQLTPLARAICSGVLAACANATTNTGHPRPLPKTTAESDARFAPYKKSLEKLSSMLNLPPESASYDHH